MKRLAVCILCLGIFLVSCAQKPDVKINTSLLNLKATVEYGEMVYNGIFTTDQNGNCEFLILAPEHLKNFSVSANSDGLLLKYKGFTQKIPASDITEGAFIYEIFECLKSIPTDPSVKITPNGAVYEGECNGRAFTFEFNADGSPKVLAVRSMNLTVKFNK